MAARELPNLGVNHAGIIGVTPDDQQVTEGWYNDGKVPHRADGKPSMVDMLPPNLFSSQTRHEEYDMAITPAVKPPGAVVQATPTNPKLGPKNNLNYGTGNKAPNPGNRLK